MDFLGLATEVDEFINANGPHIGDDFVKERFNAVYRQGLYQTRLNELVAQLTDDRGIDARRVAGADSVILHSSAAADWAIIRQRQPAKTVSLTPVHSLSVNLDAAPVEATNLRTSNMPANEVFDHSVRLVADTPRRWAKGEVLVKDHWTRTEKLHYEPGSPPLILRLNSKFVADFEWVFDPASGQPLRHICVHPGETNLDTIFDLVMSVGEQESINYMLPYTRHKLHFVRWKAIRVITALDGRVGLELLREAQNDAHQEVRSAAKRELSLVLA